jgi:hypothetical protein
LIGSVFVTAVAGLWCPALFCGAGNLARRTG